MALAPIFKGIVTNGEFIPESHDEVIQHLSKWEGLPVEAVFRKARKKYTPKQSGYFHAVIVPLWGDYMGYNCDVKSEFDYVKQYLKEQYGVKITKIMDDGSEAEILKSTAEYTTNDYAKLIDGSRQGAAMNGILIPEPGEIEYEE